VIDATCPIVLRIQDRVKRSVEAGEFVLIFGKPDHPEVIGLVGQTGGKAMVFRKFEELDLGTLPSQITLYSQTTMGLEEFYQVKSKLEESGFQVNLKDTVCRHVSGRKAELAEFSRQHDCIVFISGTESSNGKVLFGVCSNANPRSHKVSAVDQIDQEWFSPGESVGVCGATSTPQWQLEQTAKFLSAL
jgi:4-hydroxy-3-methylbut-2-enyl diphosphate reductase